MFLNSSGITPPATVQSLYMMMVNTMVFFTLTWLFDNVRRLHQPDCVGHSSNSFALFLSLFLSLSLSLSLSLAIDHS